MHCKQHVTLTQNCGWATSASIQPFKLWCWFCAGIRAFYFPNTIFIPGFKRHKKDICFMNFRDHSVTVICSCFRWEKCLTLSNISQKLVCKPSHYFKGKWHFACKKLILPREWSSLAFSLSYRPTSIYQQVNYTNSQTSFHHEFWQWATSWVLFLAQQHFWQLQHR